MSREQVLKAKAYEAYRKTKIESGLLYQDFVVDLLGHTIGLVVQVYGSRYYQTQVGESRTGVEIKHDEKYASTRNLWIETAEKARPREGDYAPSGINRDDNTWLYVIGDYDIVFIFPKVILRGVCGRYRLQENRTKTSLGFLLPDEHARKYATHVLTPNAEQVVAKAVKDLQELGRLLHRSVTMNPAQASFFETWADVLQASDDLV
jgi:hypothetical protein